MVWLKFAAAAGLIAASGTVLTVYADRLGDKLKISGAFVGLIILSIVSSLPELGTTISVVSVVEKPDLAAGNIFGSNTFNMVILAILDFLLGSASLFALAKVSHNKSISLSTVMTITAMLAIALGGLGNIGGVMLETPIIVFVYLCGLIYLYMEERNAQHHAPGGEKEPAWLEAAVVVASGGVVVAAGYWLAVTSDEIAVITGWGESFIGYLLLAISTSLPELVITIASLKLKEYDMAIANTVGSCFFNILMFAIADPFYDGPLLRDTGPSNVPLALVSAAMLAVTWLALSRGKHQRSTGFAKYALIALYLLGSWLVFNPS